MNDSLRLLRTTGPAIACVLFLTGCDAFRAVVPDFSDEQLGNPMAGFVPAGGSAPVAVNSSVSSTGFVSPSPMPSQQSAMTSAGLLDQAASSGVGAADAALLDAALDVSPSDMGNSGASMGLLADSLTGLIGYDDSEAPMSDASPANDALLAAALGTSSSGMSAEGSIQNQLTPLAELNPTRAPIVSSIDATEAAFKVLSPAEVAMLTNEGSLFKYTAKEQADFQTPYFEARANAIPGLAPTPGFTAVGTSPAVAVSMPDRAPAGVIENYRGAELPAAALRNNQAAIPVYGGSQRLSLQPTNGSVRPGFAQYRSGSLEFTLTFPPAVSVAGMYQPNVAPVQLSLRNIGSGPVTFQPDNILNQFPPFEIYRWNGATWATLTMDVAYNRDRQGISAPITLQPGQTTTRTESFAKVALLPLKVDLPPTKSLAIRLRINGQFESFGNIDSGYIPIAVTDQGAFPTATNLTQDANPGFVLVDGAYAFATSELR